MIKLSEDEIKEFADKLVKEIEGAGGMKQYYDQLFGVGAYDRDLVGMLAPYNETRH